MPYRVFPAARRAVLRLSAFALAAVIPAGAQVGTVASEARISATSGGFAGPLSPECRFGYASAALGDLDGDGIVDLAVSAPWDGRLALGHGSVWILFLAPDGSVRDEVRIDEQPAGEPSDWIHDHFGRSLAPLGDLDGDGVPDLAVGAPEEEGDGVAWILFLRPDGSVKSKRRIDEASLGSSTGVAFATALGNAGDVDGDSVMDLAVGAIGGSGTVWVLLLRTDGSVKHAQRIAEGAGGFGGDLYHEANFGAAVAGLGDLDGDGTPELAVGSTGDPGGSFGPSRGAVWILFLEPDGTVRDEQKINALVGGFGGTLDVADFFGHSAACMGDLDGDGLPELAVGAYGDEDGGRAQGAVWILFLAADGTVRDELKISETVGGFGGALEPFDVFGSSVASLGDLDGDGVGDLAVGAEWDDDGGLDQGALWVLFLEGLPEACLTLDFETEDDLATPLVNGQHLDTEFGVLATLSATGPNAGLAVFDSTVGGPNDPSQDPDLLVGTGNVLVLQTENLPPDANDVFPRPNDDEDGGTLSFALARPMRPHSVRLVDVDRGDGGARVVLTDSAGRSRAFAVPPDWTGDRMLGDPGHAVLELATLAEQAGFGSTASASQDFGFDADATVRIDVELDGSGALDDLLLCSSSLPRASARARNGSGANPSNLAALAPPALGASFVAELDCAGFASGLATLVVRRRPASAPSALGEVLVGGELLRGAVAPHRGDARRFAWFVPLDLSLLGLEAHAQGLCRGAASAGPRHLSRGSLSNALDLVLGLGGPPPARSTLGR